MLAHKLRRAMAGASGGSLTLTQKGYGHVYGASSTANLAMSYANVDGGSAPVADDLVTWIVLARDTSAQSINDLTGSGWTQLVRFSTIFESSILAKVVVAGDISSPPTVVTSPVNGSLAFWVAYTITGSIASLSILPSPINMEFSTTAAPSNQTCDSSGIGAGEIAVTLAAGGGDDGSPSTAMSGATADIDFSSAANVWLGSSAETRFLAHMAVGGANITISKGDDGAGNHLTSGYVVVG